MEYGDIKINYIEGWCKNEEDNSEGMYAPKEGRFIIGWIAKDRGFGELTIHQKDGKLYIVTEYMSKEFCRAVLMALLEQGELR